MAALIRQQLLKGTRALTPVFGSSAAHVHMKTDNVFNYAQTSCNTNVMLSMVKIAHLPSLVQNCALHTSVQVSKKHDIKEEHLELVNVLSPQGSVLAQATPLMYLERFCGYFSAYTYEEVSDDSQEYRSLKILRKADIDSCKKKGPRNVKLSSSMDLKTLKKLRNIVIADGIVTLYLMQSQKKNNIQKLEQHIKAQMEPMCTFKMLESTTENTSFRLTLKTENELFFKSIFDIIYKREKEDVENIIDYIKTVQSFSEKTDS